ncbi:ABC transporter permease [Deminuibacter soli]|uniref:ABC transporter permease n=1 Tax=Deminuibacter soli TaxID=2291815 RepID=A0A3E1NF61_9BACT|nr:ABC transporter permease subunit [Deminuibacter soli]RFM26502.1 ABC transporter permease [Deminuibacter soli]
MWTILQAELFKIFKRPRTYIAFAAIAALITMVQVGMKADGDSYVKFMLSTLGGNFDVQGKIMNGYLVCYIILQMLLVHVPLLVTLIAADTFSGEANTGTLRLLLTTPYSRTQWVLAKFTAVVIYTLLLLVWLAILALVLSMAVFGTDDLFLFKSDYVVLIRENDVFWRYCAAFGFAALAMITVAAVGFLLSIFADNSIGPIVATMSIIVFFSVLSTMNIPLYNTIKPYLFVTHMNSWKEFFDERVTENNEAVAGSIQYPMRIVHSVLVLGIHILVLLGAAVWFFRKKDILS